MGERIDYYDNPDAPPANSIKPSAAAFVLHDDKILLTCRTDNGNWTMPGGAQDPGESLTATAIRETLEETGIAIRATGVAAIYTDPKHVIHYTSDDEVRQEFTIVYRAEYVSGEPTASSETTQVEWVLPPIWTPSPWTAVSGSVCNGRSISKALRRRRTWFSQRPTGWSSST